MNRILTFLTAAVIALTAFPSFVTAADTEIAGKDTVTVLENQEYALTLEVSEGGKYIIIAEYCPDEIYGTQIQCDVLIDGERKRGLCLNAEYGISDIKKDSQGNELTPEWLISDKICTGAVQYQTAFSIEALVLELNSGAHSVSLVPTNSNLKIKSISLLPCSDSVDYKEYISNNKNNTVDDGATAVTVQAEDLLYATSKVIQPFCDSSSADITPVAEKLQVINALGGSSWNLVGQEAAWSFDVKKSGWYSLSVRYRQDYTDGRDSVRSLKMDGEMPFKECNSVAFPYQAKWKDLNIGGEETFRFYLKQGSHTVSLTPSLGDMKDVLSRLDSCITELNSVYRRIIMITSSTPDSYRDYRLEEKIPETVKKIGTMAKELSNIIELMPPKTNATLLERVVIQLEKMYKYPDSIASQLSSFQSNLSSMGTWINDQKTQPLALDEITLYPSENGYERKSVSFITSLAHSFKRILYSFAEDYSAGGNYKGEIDVWVTTGRDQVQIIKRLISDSFTAKTNIGVNLKLINSGTVLPAIVAGIGPDAALGIDSATPINFASRGAVYDLSQFDDCGEIMKRFPDCAAVPYRYDGGLYALPETITFKMLFYRKDIFAEYGWKIPETWDDVRSLIFDMSKNNMDFGLDVSFASYCMLLTQNGGTVYSDNGSKAVFDSEEGIKAFEDYTELYSEYKIPVSFNFVNRFRTGEMPVAVVDYTMYNTLEVFAPEINGLWDISVVPGTPSDDGTVNHTSVSGGTSSIILKDTENPDLAWEFLKWWTSADIQAKFGNQIEDKLGGSARYATANTEAVKEIPWNTGFYKQLTGQLENVVGVPEVPGGYYMGRNFTNAFRSVVYDDSNARETLIEYMDVINREITKKREEFGLSTE